MLIIILIGITAAIIGALPFGLVNLTVLDTAYRRGRSRAMNIAFGAAWMEVVFGLFAIILGSKIVQITNNYRFIHYLIAYLPGLVGIIFLFKKRSNNYKQKTNGSGVLKGILLNLISLQVLLYWIIAIAFLSNYPLQIESKFEIFVFLLGIWSGKIIVLWFYAYWSKKIITKWQFLSLNMNRIIGSILLFTVIIQFLK